MARLNLFLAAALAVTACSSDPTSSSETREQLVVRRLTLSGKSAQRYSVESHLSPEEFRDYVKGTAIDGQCALTVPPKHGVFGKFVEIDMEACEGIAAYSSKWAQELFGHLKQFPIPSVGQQVAQSMITCTSNASALWRFAGMWNSIDETDPTTHVNITRAGVNVRSMSWVWNYEVGSSDLNEYCVWGQDSTHVRNAHFTTAIWSVSDTNYVLRAGTSGHGWNPMNNFALNGSAKHIAYGIFRRNHCLGTFVDLPLGTSLSDGVQLRSHNKNQASYPTEDYETGTAVNIAGGSDICGSGVTITSGSGFDYGQWEP
jgi:hypothetical protein